MPALYLSGGTEFVGRPAGWGAEQIGAYTAQNYHQPSALERRQVISEAAKMAAAVGMAASFLSPTAAVAAGMVKDARFGFWCGLIIASDDSMPTWNAGDEFEAARMEALKAVGG